MFRSARGQVTRLDFIIGGVQKAGTTALHEYLKQHPNITMPRGAKELHFFDNDEYFRGAEIDYAPLHAPFRTRPQSLAAGECTPIYFFWRAAMPRIHAYNPRIRLIFILRDPIERAYSQYNMQRERGTAPNDFVEAMEAAPANYAAASETTQSRKHTYVARGLYADQIERARSYFPEPQLLFLKYEEFRREQQGTVDRVCEFLTVPRTTIHAGVQPHRSKNARKLSSDERERLLPLFRADITRVEQLLAWDCADWLR